jgi:hypothetical protein
MIIVRMKESLDVSVLCRWLADANLPVTQETGAQVKTLFIHSAIKPPWL